MKNNKFKKPKKVFLKETASMDHQYEFEEADETPKKWFEEIAEDPKKFDTVTEQVLIELKDEAKKCHDSEVANYNIKNSKTNSDHKWIKTVMSKGTVSDKIAAHIVTIQDNPVHNLEALRNLVGLVKVGKKKECTIAMDVLTDLFLNDILKPDRKLKAFHERPLSLLNEMSSGNAVSRRRLLSFWYFEDQLKELYTAFVLALNNVSRDTIDNNKEKAITAMAKLLAGNPEQEKNLLAYLVNKLGDPSQKVASKAIYNLTQLLFKHSNMQEVVLKEVERLLYRPNVSSRAQYYGLCFLSQFYLSHEASEVAQRLIEVYFSFFNSCIKKGEVDTRMMSALLMGVNRAYPYAKLELSKISNHINTMYRVVHLANFNIGLQALILLYQVSDYANDISDRFYSALYKKLVDPKLITTTHQAMLLSLIYKALLKDSDVVRIQAFVKRLLQLSLYMQPSFTCGVLYLVSQLMSKKKNVQSLILKQSCLNVLEDDDEEKYEDVKDEENYEDAKDEETEVEPIEKESEEEVKPEAEVLAGPSWYHCRNQPKSGLPQTYNPFSRNPLHAGADHSAYAELINLKDHFHPTVALYATSIMEGDIIKYSGDPLKDFTLVRFLERFVFKNPKKLEDISKKGVHPTFGKRKTYQPKGMKSLPVNSPSYLSGNQRNIPVDELFMYIYLQKKYQEKQLRDDDENSDLESVQSEEFEEMLGKMSGTRMEEEDFDFLNDVGDNLKTTKKKKKVQSDDEDSQEDEVEDESDEELSEIDEDVDDDSDLEMTEADKELLAGIEEDDGEVMFESNKDFSGNKGKKSKKKNDNDVASLFASAEEFASLLENEGGSKIAPGGSHTVSNKDNANVKQLAWEEKRNRWLHGFDKALGKGKRKKGKGHETKRTNNGGEFAHRAKKIKK